MEEQESVHSHNKRDRNLPTYLASYDTLAQHFRAEMGDLSTTEKGDRFARFIRKLFPQTELAEDFHLPALNERKSVDEGIDLISNGKDEKSTLFIQTKLWLDRAEKIDSVLSKFESYHKEYHRNQDSQQSLFDEEETPVHFMLATLSPLRGLLVNYEKKRFASRRFYDEFLARGRLHFLDGHDILPLLVVAYRKMGELPTELIIDPSSEIITRGNTYFAIISSQMVKELHDEYGDALFFENIRDFLGADRASKLGRTTPNAEIAKTVQYEPEKMLERNNGIVMRAEHVQLDDSGNRLILTNGSVVNGCQTTMCMVEYAEDICYVPVKVVQTNNSWDLTKSANYQNSVADIDLDLARSLRPQLAKRAGAHAGIHVDVGSGSAFQIVDEIYDNRLAYDESRLLFIGLFSRSPNNVYASNYTELRQDLIDAFRPRDPYGEDIFDLLFSLQRATQDGLEKAKKIFTHPSYADIYERIYRDDKPSYRCFISILSLCGAIDTNIEDRSSDTEREYERMKNFIETGKAYLDQHRTEFVHCYTLAVKTWMNEMMDTNSDIHQIRRDMSLHSKGADFTGMYRKLRMELDLDHSFKTE